MIPSLAADQTVSSAELSSDCASSPESRLSPFDGEPLAGLSMPIPGESVELSQKQVEALVSGQVEKRRCTPQKGSTLHVS